MWDILSLKFCFYYCMYLPCNVYFKWISAFDPSDSEALVIFSRGLGAEYPPL